MSVLSEDIHEPEHFTIKTLGDKLSLYSFGQRFTTVEEVLAAANIDPNQWRVDMVSINHYETGMRVDEKHDRVRITRGALVVPMTSIRLRLRPTSNIEAVDVAQFLDDIRVKGPVRKGVHRVSPVEPHMLEISIPDMHLTMRAVSGDDMTIERANELYMTALEDLVRKSRGFGVEKVLFPFGNDYLNVDREPGVTSRGTQVGGVGDWYKAFVGGQRLLIEAIDFLRTIAPVEVLSIPGNHDHQSTVAYGHVLEAYYSRDADVTVLCGPQSRRYVHYGRNLIGFDHGSPRNSKGARLGALMASEAPQEWAASDFREWHLADQHRKGTAQPIAFSEQGVSVEYLPSLAPTSHYEYASKWTRHLRSSLAFLWHKTNGPVARFQHNVVD